MDANRTLKELQTRAFNNKIAHGFNTTDINLEFNLLYGEVSEAFEAYRKNKPDLNFELADIIIYVLGIAEILGINIEEAVLAKMAINESRKYQIIDGVPVRNENTNRNIEPEISGFMKRFLEAVKKPDEEFEDDEEIAEERFGDIPGSDELSKAISGENTVIFVTHNKGKIESAKKYLQDIVAFQPLNEELDEIRGSLDEIAAYKVRQAYQLTGSPSIAMDAGFVLEAFTEKNGAEFPGSYTRFITESIGTEGILKLMEGKKNRSCSFQQSLAYYDGSSLKIFHGEHKGIVSLSPKGKLSADDWSDISLIFIPAEEAGRTERTLAELKHEERVSLAQIQSSNNCSAFAAFRDWYLLEKNAQK